MLTMFKIEIKRAYQNYLFLIAFLIGFIISLSHFIQYILPMVQYLPMPISKGIVPGSVFNNWFGGNYHTLQVYIFYLILPVLAVIPFADTYFLDQKSGVLKSIFTRTHKKYYYAAKLIATFLVGGTVVCVPLLTNLILTAAFIPSVLPQVTSGTFTISPLSMWCDIFYINPYLYIFMYLGIDFIFAGILATFSLSISFYVRNRFMVLVAPFVICYFASTILRLNNLGRFDLFSFLQPCQPVLGITFISVFIIMIVSFLLSAGIFLCKGMNDETY